jgi:serine O-acetyltransferase
MKLINEFNLFLSRNSFVFFEIENDFYEYAVLDVKNDIEKHFNSNITLDEVQNRIVTNQNELAIYFYRLGRRIYLNNNVDTRLSIIHGLMRLYCSCEIYFSNEIGKGFYIVHGLGTVIGSRNIIGENFRIHQGCTIGHKRNGLGTESGAGAILGSDVTMYANSSIIGDVQIGNNVTLGINSLVTESVESNQFVK